MAVNASCDFCRARGPVHDVAYRQNTGMLMMRQTKTFRGHACRACSGAIFRKTTLHNLVFGWWGVISLFATPLFIVNNVVCWLGSRRLPAAQALKTGALDERREYALNLLAGKDLETVTDVIARDSGLPRAEVEAWLRSLPRSG